MYWRTQQKKSQSYIKHFLCHFSATETREGRCSGTGPINRRPEQYHCLRERQYYELLQLKRHQQAGLSRYLNNLLSQNRKRMPTIFFCINFLSVIISPHQTSYLLEAKRSRAARIKSRKTRMRRESCRRRNSESTLWR